MAPRPTTSIWTDLAKAGTGLAVGLKNEREKQNQDRIAATMRQFQQDLALRQLGMQQQGIDINKAQLNESVNENDRKAASDEAQRLLLERQIKGQEDNRRLDNENARLDRKFRYDQLDRESALKREQMRTDASLKRFDIAKSTGSALLRELNTANDNLRMDESQILASDPVLRATSPVGELAKVTTQLAAIEQKYGMDKAGLMKDPAYVKLNETKGKITDLLDIREQRRQLRSRQREIVLEQNNINRQIGEPEEAIQPSWDDLSPEDKNQRLQSLANTIKLKTEQGLPIDYEPFREFGVSEAELEYARKLAGVSQDAPVDPVRLPPVTVGGPTMRTPSTPEAPKSILDSVMNAPSGPLPEQHYPPAYHAPPFTLPVYPPTGPIMNNRRPRPVRNQAGSPSSLLTPNNPGTGPRPFGYDKQPGLHRIVPPRPF